MALKYSPAELLAGVAKRQKTFELVGRYMWEWSLLETGINRLIRQALGLTPLQGAIVTANISVRDKINIARTLLSLASKSEQWRESADGTMKKIIKLSVDRNLVAHTSFQPPEKTDGIEFLQIKAKGRVHIPEAIWTTKDCEARYAVLTTRFAEVSQIIEDLRPLSGDALAAVLAGEFGVHLGLSPPRPAPQAPNLRKALALRLQEDRNAPKPSVPKRARKTPAAKAKGPPKRAKKAPKS